jgi:hypothetical protein
VLLGTPFGELIGNIGDLKGTKDKRKKIPLPPPSTPPTQNLKEKKSRHFECLLSLPIGCMKFLIPKLFVTIFGLD